MIRKQRIYLSHYINNIYPEHYQIYYIINIDVNLSNYKQYVIYKILVSSLSYHFGRRKTQSIFV